MEYIIYIQFIFLILMLIWMYLMSRNYEKVIELLNKEIQTAIGTIEDQEEKYEKKIEAHNKTHKLVCNYRNSRNYWREKYFTIKNKQWMKKN